MLEVLVGELHRHPAAQGMTDDRGAVVPESVHQVADLGREATERVVRPGHIRGPVAVEVGCDDMDVLRQRGDDRIPGRAAAGDPVDEHQDRQGRITGHAVGDPMAVDDGLGPLHRLLLHRASSNRLNQGPVLACQSAPGAVTPPPA